jgi:LysR family transcriptional regulator, hydrogen peroxide-inducible genes activator
VTLVERLPRGLLLTAAGERAVAQATQILRAVDELVEQASLQGHLVSGPLRIGVIPTMAPYVLPQLVPVLAARFPAAELHLRELRTAAIVTELRSGRLDLGILAVPVPESQGVVSEPVASDPFLLAVSHQHPLAAGHTPLDVEVLHDLEVLLLEDGHCLRTQALEVCQFAGAQPTTVHDTSLATLVQIVASGNGVTLLPLSAAAVEARPGNGITLREFRAPTPSRTIGLAWRATSPRDANYRELAELFRPVLALPEQRPSHRRSTGHPRRHTPSHAWAGTG